jgi:cytochrome d ubiquinol oxidase subunit I
LLDILAATAEPEAMLPARWQMAMSLGSHIILSCFGVAFPVIMYVMHRKALTHDDPVTLGLAKRWSKVAAVLFAVGAVSGTILSFEMGILWPNFMGVYGDVIGLPFALEGIAFFIEAIFIGIYLYGWDRLPPRVHLATLVPIGISGAVGTFCILSVNAWMNSPSGFDVVDGEVTNIDPLAAMFNNAVGFMALHMYLATFMVAGFMTASVYAYGMLKGRNDRHHQLGFLVPFAFASVAALIQPFSGHLSGVRLAEDQPAKLAAMELTPHTEKAPAPLAIGGIMLDGEKRFSIDVPWLGSLLARNDFNKPIQGLNEFAADERPKDGLVTLVHWSLQGMIGIGSALMVFGVAFWALRKRGVDLLQKRWFLKAAVIAGPAAILAMELGWITTEVGRQPWIAQDHMRVVDAVTGAGNLWISFGVLVTVYTAMGTGAVLVLRSMARRWREGEALELPTPYGPNAIKTKDQA